jgi:hypothetical protein
VDSNLALLDLVVKNFTVVSCHDRYPSLDALSHDVVLYGAFEWACENQSLDAV